MALWSAPACQIAPVQQQFLFLIQDSPLTAVIYFFLSVYSQWTVSQAWVFSYAWYRVTPFSLLYHFDSTLLCYFNFISFFFNCRFQINVFLWQECLQLKLLRFSLFIWVPLSTQVSNSYIKLDSKLQYHPFNMFFWENALSYLEAWSDAAGKLYCQSNDKPELE